MSSLFVYSGLNRRLDASANVRSSARPLTDRAFINIAEGAASGIKSIEHLSEFRIFRECAGKVQPYDAERCRPLFDRLAAKNVWQTPTLGFMRMLG